MNEFDRHLETELRSYLDRVVAAPVPVRRLPRDLFRSEAQLPIELPALSLVAVPVEVFS